MLPGSLVEEPARHPAPRAVTGRAACLVGPRQVRLESICFPEPRPGELRVRMLGCGVCASNVPLWEGRPWFEYPREPGSPGHEGWGLVDQVGEGVARFRPGDPVAVLSYHAFADYDYAPQEQAVRIPAVLQGLPFPGEPLGCAMNILDRSDIVPGAWTAVVGIGFLGAMLVQLAARRGARVIGLARGEASRRRAQQYGAEFVTSLDDANEAVRLVEQQTGGAGCPRVLEVTGKQQPLDVATRIVGTRGKLIIAGYHQDGLRHVDMQLWNWRGIDVINAHERDEAVYVRGIQRAVEAAERRELDAARLFTHIYPLEQLGEALAAASERPAGFVKALVRMDLAK